jgi:hypothetical protein
LDWPPDVQLVFEAIGKAMAGGRLHPNTLKEVPLELGAVVRDHCIYLRHIPKSATGDKTGRYVLELRGSRWNGVEWRFRSGELERLSRAAAERSA